MICTICSATDHIRGNCPILIALMSTVELKCADNGKKTAEGREYDERKALQETKDTT